MSECFQYVSGMFTWDNPCHSREPASFRVKYTSSNRNNYDRAVTFSSDPFGAPGSLSVCICEQKQTDTSKFL